MGGDSGGKVGSSRLEIGTFCFSGFGAVDMGGEDYTGAASPTAWPRGGLSRHFMLLKTHENNSTICDKRQQ